MHSYIKSLLEERRETVVIPDFGALLVARDSGQYLFSPYMSYPNNTLSDYVAKKKDISPEEAQNEIKNYVDNVMARLRNGEVVVMDGIGSFKIENGVVTLFDAANAEGAAPAEDEAPAPVDLSAGLQEEQTTDAPEPQQEPEQEPEQPSYAEPEPEQGEPTHESEPASPEPYKAQSTYVYQEETSTKKKVLIVILIVLLFLICAFLCLFVINKDNAVYNFFCGEEEVQVEVVTPPAPPAPVDTAIVEEPKPIVIDENPLERNYNIVVGSYKTQAAAQERVDNLKEKGFDKAFVKQDGNWYMAVIESLDRLPQAEQRQEEIVDNYRIESWIKNAD